MESTNIRVKLNSVEQVRQFVETMRKYDGDVDVYSSNRNYLVDGKSILGVFSLGLDQELTVVYKYITAIYAGCIRSIYYNNFHS